MNSNNTSLSISGYKNAKFSSKDKIGIYKLQLNPAELTFNVGQKEGESSQDEDASGTTITSKAKVFIQRTLDLKFILDNTGAIPNSPAGVKTPSNSIVESIKLLERITILPIKSTHRPPFVWLNWGKGVSIKGIITSLQYDYIFFNAQGAPLRAQISLKIQDFDNTDANLFQSPDITKMPIVKDKDTLVKLSEEYYEDKSYYIKLASFNNLSSIRSLKVGKQLEIPPIN